MKSAIRKRYTVGGFGFPVVLHNVKMVEVCGEWAPCIDYDSLTRLVVKGLGEKEGKLTGNEVAFARQYAQMSLRRFAARFGVTHQAVMKWESAGAHATNMEWSTEKDLRMFLFELLFSDSLSGASELARDVALELVALYKALESKRHASADLIEIDARKIPAPKAKVRSTAAQSAGRR